MMLPQENRNININTWWSCGTFANNYSVIGSRGRLSHGRYQSSVRAWQLPFAAAHQGGVEGHEYYHWLKDGQPGVGSRGIGPSTCSIAPKLTQTNSVRITFLISPVHFIQFNFICIAPHGNKSNLNVIFMAGLGNYSTVTLEHYQATVERKKSL